MVSIGDEGYQKAACGSLAPRRLATWSTKQHGDNQDNGITPRDTQRNREERDSKRDSNRDRDSETERGEGE